MTPEKYTELYTSALNFFLQSEIDNPKERTGGHFTVVEASGDQDAIEVVEIGIPLATLPSDEFAKEKARRLMQRQDDICTFQSRNPDAGQWGGAIRANEELIFSMSGLPEHADEAINLSVAMKTGNLTEERLQAVIEASENPYLELIRKFQTLA